MSFFPSAARIFHSCFSLCLLISRKGIRTLVSIPIFKMNCFLLFYSLCWLFSIFQKYFRRCTEIKFFYNTQAAV